MKLSFNGKSILNNSLTNNLKKADVAIIMPCNNRDYVYEAIHSIRSQTYTNWMLICVGKESDPALQFIIDLKDDRIIYLQNEEPTLASSYNIALKFIEEFSNVKYITRCDDDDLLNPEKVKICYNYLETHPKTFLVHHAYQTINEKNEFTGDMKNLFNQEELLEYSNILDGTIMYRAKPIMFLDESIPGLSFYDLFIKMTKNDYKIDNLNLSLYQYRLHSDNFVKKMDLEKNYEIIRKNNNLKSEDFKTDVLIFYSYLGVESGITASAKHLKKVLENNGLSVRIHATTQFSLLGLRMRCNLLKPSIVIINKLLLNEEELKNFCSKVDAKVIILEHAKNSFAQTYWERTNAHNQSVKTSKLYKNCLVATTNEDYSNYLTELHNVKVLYFPNTFCTDFLKYKKQEKKMSVINLSLLCEVRPLKNLITQLSACQLIGKRLREQGKDLNVHLSTRGDKIFIHDLKTRVNELFFNIIWHDTMSFEENLEVVRNMDLCLQVSYTETLNYYALEHEVQGIPCISSQGMSIGKPALSDNALDITDKALNVLNNYANECLLARKRALNLVKKNNDLVIKTIKGLMK